MHFTTPLAFPLLLLTTGFTFAFEEPALYEFGLTSTDPSNILLKRAEGYQPTQRRCGAGSTCSVACGTEYETCPSTDNQLHCYDPTIRKQNCCTDGSGNACREKYFCTNDSRKRTWCCPDGLDLVSCAKSYGLTDTLVSLIPNPTGRITGTGSVPEPSGTDYPPSPPLDTTMPAYPYPNVTYTYEPTYVTGTGSVPLVTATSGPDEMASVGPCVGGCNETTTEVSIADGTATNTPSQVTSLPPAAFTGGAMSGYGVKLGWIGVVGGALGFAVIL